MDIFVTICKEVGLKILDCTLRDGAYVVDSMFGDRNIKNIIKILSDTGIDIIECGWLRDLPHEKDSVYFNIPDDAREYITQKSSKFALMFDYGRYDINNLPHNNGLIDIIRIAFYKKNLDGILFAAEKVKSRGYKVFLQPSNIRAYTENEIIKLCRRGNFIGADAIYIVDSFGSMFPEDLENIIPIFDETVSKNIEIGFHSHNNIQLSFALTIQFINSLTNRNIIIDSSLCGLGRGAGNTKTELLIEYLDQQGIIYNKEALWGGINDTILPFYDKYNWEYTPKHGFKGIYKLHPNTNI